MSFLERLKETASERPRRFALAVTLILFWIAAPLIAQMFFNRSAIVVSFSVTVLYYVAWKAYEHFFREE